MLLTISTTQAPATDLGYLLHKHPDRCQSFDLAFGKAHVFYPEAGEDRCTAALLLDVDPVGLVRNRRGPAGEGFHLRQYVNDRPFVASSLMSVAIARVFGSALSGRCEERSELVEQPIPLTAKLSVVPCRGGEVILRRLFEPLGYRVTATRHPLDDKFPEWGESSYYTVELSAECSLQDLLAHLYVLIPVLDDDKHYWVTGDEVDKLLRKGEGWLESHPEKELIARRYLKHQTGLMRAALDRLVEEESPDADEVEEAHAAEEEAVEAPLRLNDQRLEAVVTALHDAGAKSVVDLGCGEGKLLRLLLKGKSFERIIGMDVSYRTLEIAQRRLNFDRLPPKQRERIELIHGSLMYRDERLAGFDAATIVEVIEHLDAPRLAAFERVVFECARPRTVIVTTPSIEYNVRFETLPAGKFRHKDHRFEWTRAEFQTWASGVAKRFAYAVLFAPVGPEDIEVGSPTQMGVFRRG
ncbi:MAG: 3' terminal RNA ribose 2'-O-methyltransferase Hen1 [Planctomycetota bacterium]|nr:3' terminal RNA ribose 2'-O-methyltransferase Hen1 [Planctomycetota bacterium]